VSQKVTLSLLNEARFLLESHVLQITEATTPMRQLYFVVQSLLINPQDSEKARGAYRKLYEALLVINADEGIKAKLKLVDVLVAADRTFEALKIIRTLFEPQEAKSETPNSFTPVQAA
jgi:flagellar protein FlbT